MGCFYIVAGKPLLGRNPDEMWLHYWHGLPVCARTLLGPYIFVFLRHVPLLLLKEGWERGVVAPGRRVRPGTCGNLVWYNCAIQQPCGRKIWGMNFPAFSLLFLGGGGEFFTGKSWM